MSSPLLAMLLVTSSSRGSYVIFQWPRKPSMVKRYSHVRYYADTEADETPEPEDAGDYLADASDTDSYDSDSSTTYSDASFENDAVVIGNAGDERSWRDTSCERSRMLSSEHSSRNRSASCSRRPRLQSSIHAVQPEELARIKSYTTYLGFDYAVLAAMLSPKPEQCHHKFELIVDDMVFLGAPVLLGHDSKTKDTGVRNSMTMFNLVMVFDRPDSLAALPGMDHTTWMQLYYTLLFKLTAVLFAQESSAGYVSEQNSMLLALRDKCMQNGLWVRDFLQEALLASSLARTIREVQRCLVRNRNALVQVNGVDVHLQLPLLLLQPERASKAIELLRAIDLHDMVVQRGDGPEPRDGLRTSGLTMEQRLQDWTRTTGPFLEPWKTLLFPEGNSLGDELDTILTFVQPLIECFRPTLRGSKTFLQASESLHLDLYKEVYPMVRHFIYYSKAQVVDVPRIQSTYTVDPTLDMDRCVVRVTYSSIVSLKALWSAAFPMMRSLPQFLSDLGGAPRPFVAHFAPRINHSLCFDTLLWLLRHNVVVQLHTYLRLIVTAQDRKRAASLRSAKRELHGKQRDTGLESGSEADEMLLDVLRSQRTTKFPERPALPQCGHAHPHRVESSDSSGDEWPPDHSQGPSPLQPSSHLSKSRTSTPHDLVDELEADEIEARMDELKTRAPPPALIREPVRANRTENEWISAMLAGKHAWYTRWFLRYVLHH
ncbi:Nitrogen permease regulator 3 [Malassezia vespertilionis]|uniref:Nitrogen permease regulator 3 n=1 Tax=Malassezia vespertilionis TaxID=2020962 RepID=UPI0024B19ADC|nr:Nitrogen permease regulator 3 [Malassezia vespertilionis]WFD08222.1 Nitrogen permease regulator 3 [Malassezia vespertilionis]